MKKLVLAFAVGFGLSTAIALAIGLTGCASQAPADPLAFPSGGGGEGKEDVFGRKLVGVAQPYAPADLDEETLKRDMKKRREAAWATALKVLEPTPLLGLAESAGSHEEIRLPNGQVPRVPRFQTWYGVDDIKRIFQHLYDGLGANGRAARKKPDDGMIEEALTWNSTALDRSDRWSLERYFDHVNRLGICPEGTPSDQCARDVMANFSGAAAGNPRILYSPATVKHLLRNYARVVDCLAKLDNLAVGEEPALERNFSLCFEEEMPKDAVLVKSQWVRADLGRGFPTFDTDGDSLARRLDGTAEWSEAGDRETDPTPSDIYTIRLRDGSLFRLAGIHIMTKEIRHWQWITLWWSDKPDQDFGADRPRGFEGPFKNYKMCAVSWYDEQDPNVVEGYADKPSLAAALRASDATVGKPSWCSNPYLEHGRNNARTNCIGCHQHGGATRAFDQMLEPEKIIGDELKFPATGRAQLRELFPADYLYSFNRVDDFAHVISGEVNYFDRADLDAARPRITKILALAGDREAGAERFADNCARCHAPNGLGTSRAPSLAERVPLRDDESILRTLLQGKGNMPKWGDRFDDQALADLLAHLRASFGSGPSL